MLENKSALLFFKACIVFWRSNFGWLSRVFIITKLFEVRLIRGLKTVSRRNSDFLLRFYGFCLFNTLVSPRNIICIINCSFFMFSIAFVVFIWERKILMICQLVCPAM